MIENLFFTEPSLDRLSLMREDSSAILSIMKKSCSLFLVGHGDNLFLAENDKGFSPALFTYPDVQHILQPEENTILVGRIEENYYFLIQIDDPEEMDFATGDFLPLRPVRGKVDPSLASVTGTAVAYLHWHRRAQFCRDCGAKTQMAKFGHERLCKNPSCGKHHFPRTDPAVIVAVNSPEGLLLARQPHWPKKMYSIIAGFLEPGESLEQTVIREVWEETGIQVEDVQYQGSQPWPFPASLMLGFTAEALTTDIRLLDNELEKGGWFSRKQIIEGVHSGRLKLPTSTSISFQLVKQWFEREEGYDLTDVLSKVTI